MKKLILLTCFILGCVAAYSWGDDDPPVASQGFEYELSQTDPNDDAAWDIMVSPFGKPGVGVDPDPTEQVIIEEEAKWAEIVNLAPLVQQKVRFMDVYIEDWASKPIQKTQAQWDQYYHVRSAIAAVKPIVNVDMGIEDTDGDGEIDSPFSLIREAGDLIDDAYDRLFMDDIDGAKSSVWLAYQMRLGLLEDYKREMLGAPEYLGTHPVFDPPQPAVVGLMIEWAGFWNMVGAGPNPWPLNPLFAPEETREAIESEIEHFRASH